METGVWWGQCERGGGGVKRKSGGKRRGSPPGGGRKGPGNREEWTSFH